MSEIISWTIQLSTLLAVVFTLFKLYGGYVKGKDIIIQSKDATIENLKTQLSDRDNQIKELKETSPDILLKMVNEKLELYKKYLTEMKEEDEKKTKRVEELEAQINTALAANQLPERKSIQELLLFAKMPIASTEESRALEEKINQIQRSLNLYSEFIPAFSFGRQKIVAKIVNFIGTDFVYSATPEELKQKFSEAVSIINQRGELPGTGINGGALTGIRSHNLIDGDDRLTPFGVSLFKVIAEALLSAKSLD